MHPGVDNSQVTHKKGNLCLHLANYNGGGDTSQKKHILEGGNRTYFVDWGNNWGGDTAQHLENQSRYTAGWLGGWLSQ